MCDWNNNGRFDMEDAFINYHINRSMSGKNNTPSGDSGSGKDIIAVIGVVLLVLGIIILFI